MDIINIFTLAVRQTKQNHGRNIIICKITQYFIFQSLQAASRDRDSQHEMTENCCDLLIR